MNLFIQKQPQAKPPLKNESDFGILSVLRRLDQAVGRAGPSSATTFSMTEEQTTTAIVVVSIASAGVAVGIGTNLFNAISARQAAKASMIPGQGARTVAETAQLPKKP